MASPTINTFPVEYLDAIDEVLVGASYASRYNVGAAEWVSNRQVSVPDISFGNSPSPTTYNRFSSEAAVTITRSVYTLDHDVEKVFYVDAVDAIDEPAANITTISSEYERTILAPYVDTDFFAKAYTQAATKASDQLNVNNIGDVVAAARTQFVEAGLHGGDLYMTSAALRLLEKATDRQWSNETSINETVGSYDGFSIFEVPSAILGADLIAIAGGERTIRYITKRVATYYFAPGQHTQGDGHLSQFRWLFGNIVYKNKKPGIFASKYTA